MTTTEQTVAASYTLGPAETTAATELGGPRGVTGYVLNGVKIDAGTAGTCSDSRPSTDTYPLGTFSQDWEYVEGSGDLDECNGRVGVTPEFPGSIRYTA